MYLSGRPLHALTVQLAHRLAEDVEHPLMMSFSGGADAHNMAALIRSGMRTITVCSDLLRPGGYLRFGQYLDELEERDGAVDADNIESFVCSGVCERGRQFRGSRPAKSPGVRGNGRGGARLSQGDL